MYIKKLYLIGRTQLKIPMEVYMLSTGKEKAATENERIPRRALIDNDNLRFGNIPKKNSAIP